MDYWNMVEEAWNLSDEARELAKNESQDLTPEAYWEHLFSKSAIVDVERTKRDGGSPLSRVFLKSPYGLQYRPDFKDWIPFRHGEVKIA